MKFTIRTDRHPPHALRIFAERDGGHVEIASGCATPDEIAALRALVEQGARVVEAARALCKWDPRPHASDCAHRNCEGDDCGEGEDAEDCEVPLAECTCSRFDEDELRTALRATGAA